MTFSRASGVSHKHIPYNDYLSILFHCFLSSSDMRFILTIVCIIVGIAGLATAFPQHSRMRRGPIDLSGLTGPGGMSFICIFPPCPVQPIIFPTTIDWDALHASIAQWNKEQEELALLSANN